MNSDQIALIHETISEGDWITAANLAFAADGIDLNVDSEPDAKLALQTLERNLHDAGMYREQAVLLWGNKMFNANPSPVLSVFSEVSKHQKLLIMGSSGLSKTYSCGVLYYLYWRMDPLWTNVILCSTSESSLRGNLFSHIIALHQAAVIPMGGGHEVKINNTDMEISVKGALPEMKIEGVLLKSGSDSSGSLRGRKPKPYRKETHPKHGNSSRILMLLDEATNIPDGAFADIGTTISAINPATDNVKIVAAFNPINLSTRIVRMSEPEDGWQVEQVDTLHIWVSKEGWNVLRLDAKNFENIIERRVIYEGMQTYEAYLGFLKQGDKSADYWALARGFPPLADSAWTVVPPAWMQSQVGEPIYRDAITIASLDTALGGSDKAVMAVGRWGEADGWINRIGERVMFLDRTNPALKKPRHVLVIDQIFTLPKTDNTVDLIEGVMERCKIMGIRPEHVSMDATGNAAGVWGHATKFWGNCLGVKFGEKASELKVIAEDNHTALEVYDGKVTELWFAFKEWLNPTVTAVLFNRTLQAPELFSQMTNRRYRGVKGGRSRIEPKEEYKARTRLGSPDEADVVTLLVELVRQRMNVVPGMKEIAPTQVSSRGDEKVSLKNAEDFESLGDDNEYFGPKLETEW